MRPEEQTQEGIAAATRSGRSTLTKWLDRMEAQGLVARERVRVGGHPLPKYAYRLTETGWHTANALRERLASQVVTVRTAELPPLDVRLPEVLSLAPNRLELVDAICSIRRGRIEIPKARATSRADRPVVWGDSLRRIDRFFGRAEEMQALDAWLASDSRILFLTGLPGIGKSALVATWIESRPLRVPAFGFEIRPSTTTAEFLAGLGDFLGALGAPSLASHLSQGVPVDVGFVRRLLRRDLADRPLLVVLDNADQASRDTSRFLRGAFRELVQDLPVRTILISRTTTPSLRTLQRSVLAAGPMRIGGLDPEASRALLRHRGLGTDPLLVEGLVRTTRGHPLLLQLAASGGTTRGPVARRYLEEEVWETLGQEERSILEMISVFRKAVGPRVLAVMGHTNTGVLQRLSERGLLERTVAGRYLMHDLLRDFAQGRLTEARRRALNARAARPLLASTEARERWEGVYHLLEAGRVAEAAAFLDSDGAPLLDSVAAEEIGALVHAMALDEADAESYTIFAEILGDSLRVRGHLAPALYQYGHARNRAERSRMEDRVPRLLRKMAFIERCRNHYPTALGYLVEARARLRDRTNPTETAEVLREMALVTQASGDLGQAAAHLSEAVDLATEADDLGGLSRALLALSSLETFRGNRERGLDYAFEGLRVAGRSASLTQMAHARIVVGTALAELRQFEESLGHFDTGLQLARAIGNLRLTAYATMNRTAVLIDQGRYAAAAGSLSDARGYFEILEEHDTLALLKVHEGQLEMGLGHWHRAVQAWKDGLAKLRKFGSPVDLGRALKEVGGFHLDRGSLDEGRTYLLEAQRIARALGNETLLSEIEEGLRRHDASAAVHGSA